MSAVEGFLCDNATKTGMMIKDPVYVHKHTHTHTHTHKTLTYLFFLVQTAWKNAIKFKKYKIQIRQTNTTSMRQMIITLVTRKICTMQ